METLAKQVGGDHYGPETEYGHWDWVNDVGLNYYLGNATKYVVRWRKKNGIEDLQKAGTYVAKYRSIRSEVLEGALASPNRIAAKMAFTIRLAKSLQLTHDELMFCTAAVLDDNTQMVSSLSLLMREAGYEAAPA